MQAMMYLIARACQLPHIVHNNSADQRSNEQIGSTKYSNNKAEYVWRLRYYIAIALLFIIIDMMFVIAWVCQDQTTCQA